jgi:hypothetical protein
MMEVIGENKLRAVYALNGGCQLYMGSVTGFAETFAERTYSYFCKPEEAPRDRTACLGI